MFCLVSERSCWISLNLSGYLQTYKGGKARATKSHRKKKAQHADLMEAIEFRGKCGARSHDLSQSFPIFTNLYMSSETH